jgi:hypothetical protein
VDLKCECCGHTERFDSARDAFKAGWDDPHNMPHWPVSCRLCPGVCALGLVDHSEEHALWKESGRPDTLVLKEWPRTGLVLSKERLMELLHDKDRALGIDALGGASTN